MISTTEQEIERLNKVCIQWANSLKQTQNDLKASNDCVAAQNINLLKLTQEVERLMQSLEATDRSSGIALQQRDKAIAERDALLTKNLALELVVKQMREALKPFAKFATEEQLQFYIAKGLPILTGKGVAIYADCFEKAEAAISSSPPSEALAEVLKPTIEVLDKLARLGNGTHFGTSIGNDIAQTELSRLKTLIAETK